MTDDDLLVWMVLGVVVWAGITGMAVVVAKAYNSATDEVEEWRRKHGVCVKCGYPLPKEPPWNCPECGALPDWER